MYNNCNLQLAWSKELEGLLYCQSAFTATHWTELSNIQTGHCDWGTIMLNHWKRNCWVSSQWAMIVLSFSSDLPLSAKVFIREKNQSEGKGILSNKTVISCSISTVQNSLRYIDKYYSLNRSKCNKNSTDVQLLSQKILPLSCTRKNFCAKVSM